MLSKRAELALSIAITDLGSANEIIDILNNGGSQILSGSGSPSDDLGKDNDLYIDTVSGSFYSKENGSWVFQGTFSPGNLPSGGTTGQALVKSSDSDYDATWQTVVPTGSANTVTGFDQDGNLYSLPGWSVSQEIGLQQFQQVDLLPANFMNINVNVSPLDDSSGDYRNIFNMYTNLDPDNLGFNMGDESGGGVSLLVLNMDRASEGLMGNFNVMTGFSNIGDGVREGRIHNMSIFNHGERIQAGYTIDNYQGLSLYPHFENGSIAGSINMLQTGGQFNGVVDGFLQALAVFNNFGPTSETEHYHAIENGGNGAHTAQITDYINYNGYFNDALIGNLNGIQFSPNNLTIENFTNLGRFNISNSQLNGGATLFHIQGDNNEVNPSFGLVGMDINLGGFNTTRQKQALNINDGALTVQSDWDTSKYDLPGGVWQHNILGGVLHIADGNPINDGSFGFGNNLGITIFAEDDMEADATGINLGFSVNGFVNQIGVADGKTLHTVNYLMAGGGIFTGSGNVTNMSLIRALGFLPSGGTLNITNLYGVKIDQFLDAAGATNTWGISVEAETAENFLGKSLAIGTGTKKVSNEDVGLEIGSPKAFLPGRLTESQRDALVAIEGMVIYNVDTQVLNFYNGSSWMPL